MRNRLGPFLVAGIAAALAAVFAPTADGAVFARLLRTEAHIGDLVPAEVDAWTATRHPPLYLISAAASSEFHHDTRRSTSAAIYPSSAHPLGAIRFFKGDNSLPCADVKPGRYRLMIHCESCTAGPLGSVIGSGNTLLVG